MLKRKQHIILVVGEGENIGVYMYLFVSIQITYASLKKKLFNYHRHSKTYFCTRFTFFIIWYNVLTQLEIVKVYLRFSIIEKGHSVLNCLVLGQ